MNSKLKITIPKPCHENWNEMTPREKGRFCSSCAKTVIDFTKKSTKEIKNYLIDQKTQRVCGHFYRKQLDSITIEIPQTTFDQQLSFQKIFVLALFFVMGTTLFSCNYSDGKKQKIHDVIIVDTIKKVEEQIDSIITSKDSISNKLKETTTCIQKRKVPPPPTTTGISVINPSLEEINNTSLTTTGDVIETIETVGEVNIEGEIEFIEETEEIIMGFIIDEPPRFKESEKLTNTKAKEDFEFRMKKFIEENFDRKIAQNLGLSKGKYKIFTQFTIDKDGNTTDVKVRTPHPKLMEEVKKIFKKLPKFIPGKQRDHVVKTNYTLPISFEIE